MIELKQINKTFYKGKANEIRAIRQTSLTFPRSGLVVLSGPSGSGKTTLLNVLGGLEYIDSGEIVFGDEVIGKHNNRKLDAIRNEKIGYIFQQYNLLPNLTVYENIELVLNMLGIDDAAEIQNRIQYVLEAVGMIHYRKRKVSALSGGQQQRVGIARAIAKNPDIIIADEPTGNLDSKNTVEVMNIIKKISEHKLVVLVTHEKEIAAFYGDRIIEISDGAVVRDYVNDHQNSLDIRHQNTIYLKDLKRNTLSGSPVQVEHYTDEGFGNRDVAGSGEGAGTGTGEGVDAGAGAGAGVERRTPVKVTLITQNQSLYIKVDGYDGMKVRYVDQDSGIEVLDEHFKGLEKDTVKQYDFDFGKLASTGGLKRKKRSAIPAGDAFKSAFKKIFGYSKLQKLMFLGFVFAAMSIACAVALIGKVYHVDPSDFQRVDSHYVLTDVKDPLGLNNQGAIAAVNPLHEPQRFGLQVRSFYQVDQLLPLQAHPSDIRLLQEKDVILGRYPQNRMEVVLDQRIAESLINDSSYQQAGLADYEELLGSELLSEGIGTLKPLTIVGISDLASPTIWMDEAYLYEIAVNRLNRGKDLMKLAAFEPDQGVTVMPGGRQPEQAGEVLYPEKFRALKGYELQAVLKSDGFRMPGEPGEPGTPGGSAGAVEAAQEYRIVGFYKTGDSILDEVNHEVLLTTPELLKEQYYRFSRQDNPLLVYSDEQSLTIRYLEDNGFSAVPTYEKSLREHQTDVRRGYLTLLAFAAVLLTVSLVQLYFIIRSSLLNRIYDIGVYRSLGATRWDIQKMFVIEIAVVTTLTSLVGYILITLVLREIERMLPPTFTLFYFPLPYVIGGIVLIYAINLLSGLYPVYMLTRKSPSQILKQYDA